MSVFDNKALVSCLVVSSATAGVALGYVLAVNSRPSGPSANDLSLHIRVNDSSRCNENHHPSTLAFAESDANGQASSSVADGLTPTSSAQGSFKSIASDAPGHQTASALRRRCSTSTDSTIMADPDRPMLKMVRISLP